jgi:23S rRNA (adenine1618-N6)-methyltransferase
MLTEKNPQEKTTLHPRNKNRDRYDLSALTAGNPELAKYIKPNKFGEDSIDFSNSHAVKLLNRGLLNHYYGISYWEFPDENLCPAIPGRADYIHYIADLLGESNFGRIPTGNKITCFDIGLGANCVYPIIGAVEYGWNFIGSDVEPKSVASAQAIVNANTLLKDKIECELQKNKKHFFKGIIGAQDKIDVSICNPPFHHSVEDAQNGTRRKVKNLTGKAAKKPELNFAGINSELIYDGGESAFINSMIIESVEFSGNFYWFSTLVSKQSNLKGIYKALSNVKATHTKTITMGTGNKSTRVVAWTFLTKEEQSEWRRTRWNKKAN